MTDDLAGGGGMASGLAGEASRQMQRLLAAGTAVGLTDAQLLERFAARRDESAEVAFEALVARHGPMVYRACRALVRDPRDAEDAFQATFLVLARKADRVGAGGPLGPWLHGVARKVSLKARAASARKARREGGLASDPPAPGDPAPCPDLAPTLHEELGRLPEKYRRPVVLCHLEGLTHAEAAQELGWPVGTVSVRLSRARDLLRRRLSRRGLAPDASAFGPALLGGATPSVESLIRIASAALPSALGAASAGVLAYGKGSTTMIWMTLAKWLALPVGLGIVAAVGVTATRPALEVPPDLLAQVDPSKPKPPAPEGRPKASIDRNSAPVPTPTNPGRSPFDPDQPVPASDTPAQPAAGPVEVDDGKAPSQLTGDIPIPAGYFDISNLDPGGNRPEPVKPGQILVVEVLEALPGRPITGERVVRPDGTISLGYYGDLRVVDLDRHQIKVNLIEHLRRFINDEALGLTAMSATTAKTYLNKPVNSTRVYVDDSATSSTDRAKERAAAGDVNLRTRIEYLERAIWELQGKRSGPRQVAPR